MVVAHNTISMALTGTIGLTDDEYARLIQNQR